jgi:hypothetical protein
MDQQDEVVQLLKEILDTQQRTLRVLRWLLATVIQFALVLFIAILLPIIFEFLTGE